MAPPAGREQTGGCPSWRMSGYTRFINVKDRISMCKGTQTVVGTPDPKVPASTGGPPRLQTPVPGGALRIGPPNPQASGTHSSNCRSVHPACRQRTSERSIRHTPRFPVSQQQGKTVFKNFHTLTKAPSKGFQTFSWRSRVTGGVAFHKQPQNARRRTLLCSRFGGSHNSTDDKCGLAQMLLLKITNMFFW